MERWILIGPEISRVKKEFTDENDMENENEELTHHEEEYASQTLSNDFSAMLQT